MIRELAFVLAFIGALTLYGMVRLPPWEYQFVVAFLVGWHVPKLARWTAQ